MKKIFIAVIMATTIILSGLAVDNRAYAEEPPCLEGNTYTVQEVPGTVVELNNQCWFSPCPVCGGQVFVNDNHFCSWYQYGGGLYCSDYNGVLGEDGIIRAIHVPTGKTYQLVPLE
jgi:hypothetical protein